MASDRSTSSDPELEELLEAVLNRELTEAQQSKLAARLSADPAARAAFIRMTAYEAMLSHEFPTAEPHVASSALELPEPKRAINWRQWIMAAAAAILLIGLVINHFVPRSPTGDQVVKIPETPAAVTPLADGEAEAELIAQIATVTNVANADAFAAHRRLAPGAIDLPSGQVEITFDCGAVITLIGPARFQLDSEYKGRLHFGHLIARVPHEASGFVVQTPTSHVRDLGTAFAMNVANDGVTDLCVLEGSVDATSTNISDARPIRLQQGESRRFSSAAVEVCRFDPVRFAIPFPAPLEARAPRFVHWSFDQLEGNAMSDASHSFSLRLMRLDGNTTTVGRNPPGVFGGAISFNGDGDYAESDYPGIGGGGARTVAFWLRLPSMDENSHSNCILSWGAPEETKKWEMQWNRVPRAGIVGALRLDFGSGYVVGQTDLRDGLWHHVAAVFHGGNEADICTHVKLYVDGRFETPTGRRPQLISTDIASSKAVPVTLGRFIGIRAKRSELYFKGQLDELFIIDEPLTPGQIVKLKDSNQVLGE